MRQTVLTTGEGRKLTILTGDQGTEVLDDAGRVVGTYGTDRHEELVTRHQGEGWHVVDDSAIRPEPASRTPPPPADGPGDGFHEQDLGLSS